MKNESPMLDINIGDIFYISESGAYGFSFIKIIDESPISSPGDISFRVFKTTILNDIFSTSNLTTLRNLGFHSPLDIFSGVVIMKKSHLINLLISPRFTGYFRGLIKISIEELDLVEFSEISKKYPFLSINESPSTDGIKNSNCRIIRARQLTKVDYREIKLNKLLNT